MKWNISERKNRVLSCLNGVIYGQIHQQWMEQEQKASIKVFELISSKDLIIFSFTLFCIFLQLDKLKLEHPLNRMTRVS